MKKNFFFFHKFGLATIVLCLFVITSCSKNPTISTDDINDDKPRYGVKNPYGDSVYDLGFGSDTKNSGSLTSENGFGINQALWQASLKLVAQTGIQTVSPETGTIIGKTFQATDGSNVQISVVINGPELRSSNVDVLVGKTDSQGRPLTLNADFRNKLKDVILLNARDVYSRK